MSSSGFDSTGRRPSAQPRRRPRSRRRRTRSRRWRHFSSRASSASSTSFSALRACLPSLRPTVMPHARCPMSLSHRWWSSRAVTSRATSPPRSPTARSTSPRSAPPSSPTRRAISSRTMRARIVSVTLSDGHPCHGVRSKVSGVGVACAGTPVDGVKRAGAHVHLACCMHASGDAQQRRTQHSSRVSSPVR